MLRFKAGYNNLQFLCYIEQNTERIRGELRSWKNNCASAYLESLKEELNEYVSFLKMRDFSEKFQQDYKESLLVWLETLISVTASLMKVSFLKKLY